MILDGLWYGTAPAWQRVVALATLGPPSLAMRLGVSVRNGLFDAGLCDGRRDVAGLRCGRRNVPRRLHNTVSMKMSLHSHSIRAVPEEQRGRQRAKSGACA